MKVAKVYCCTLAVTLCASALASARMPIIGWGSWDEKGASAERYAEARDAGFTHLTQWCTSPTEAKRLLGEAEKAGIKLIIGLGHDVKRMTDAAKEFTAAAKDSPALEYYYITDEPHIRQAEAIRDCVKLYEELDPAHPCYVNLFGALCDRWTRNDVARQMKHTGCATHDEYIRRLYDVVPLKMISFDVYPVLSFKPLEVGDFRLHGQRVFLKERWYETLEATSALARERNIPMFAFALVAAHRHYPAQDYPVPTRAHLRLQQYSNLAYGAQALQCFKYAMMREYHGYNNAPILVGGRRREGAGRVAHGNRRAARHEAVRREVPAAVRQVVRNPQWRHSRCLVAEKWRHGLPDGGEPRPERRHHVQGDVRGGYGDRAQGRHEGSRRRVRGLLLAQPRRRRDLQQSDGGPLMKGLKR